MNLRISYISDDPNRRISQARQFQLTNRECPVIIIMGHLDKPINGAMEFHYFGLASRRNIVINLFELKLFG